MGDHEAAVEARVGNEERGQTACAADELVDTALRDIRELGKGEGEVVHRHCDGLAVEVAGRYDDVVVGEDGGVVGRRVDFLGKTCVDKLEGVDNGAVYLRYAPE